MKLIKERILGAITVMADEDIFRLWKIIVDEFGNNNVDWDSIPEEEPDDIDLQMLEEIEKDPDCHKFISADEAEKILKVS